jgi:hypothetical protein
MRPTPRLWRRPAAPGSGAPKGGHATMTGAGDAA